MKKLSVITFVSVLVLLLAACTKEVELKNEENKQKTIKNIPFETIIENMHHTGTYDEMPQQEILAFIEDPKELEKLFLREKDKSQIDFEKEVAVYLTRGEVPTGGYRIELERIELKGDTLILHYIKVVAGGDLTEAIENKYSLYKLEKFNQAIQHVEFKEIETVPFQTIMEYASHQGAFDEFPKEEKHLFIKNPKEIQQLFLRKEDKERIDFEKEHVVYLTRGEMPTGGYHMGLDHIVLKDNTLILYYLKEKDEGVKTEGFENLYSLYTIKKLEREINQVLFKEITK